MPDDVCLPMYYVVNRGLPKDMANFVLTALRITPIFCSVISDVMDAALAFELSSEVIRVATDDAAHSTAKKIWKETNRPSLVVGTADVLDAVYEDGRIEGVATSC